MFTAFRFPNFRIWYFGSFVSFVGTWLVRIGQDWLVLTVLTDNSGTALGTVIALQFVPMLILSPLAGVVIDRFNKRVLVFCCQASQILIAATMGVLIYTGLVNLSTIYLLALVHGVVTTLDTPLKQVFVTELVDDASLANAVNFNSSVHSGAQLIGPALAGFMIALTGRVDVLFFTSIGAFSITLVSILLLRRKRMYLKRRLDETHRNILTEMASGFRYLRTKPDLIVVLVLLGGISMLAMEHHITIATMSTKVFDAGPDGFGTLNFFLAVGGVIGALTNSRVQDPRLRQVFLAAFGMGVNLSVQIFSPNYWFFATTVVIHGFFMIRMIATVNAVLQLRSEPTMRGRVMSIQSLIFLGVTPIGSPTIGFVSDSFGARWAVAVGALSALAFSIGLGVYAVRRWKLKVVLGKHPPYIEVHKREP